MCSIRFLNVRSVNLTGDLLAELQQVGAAKQKHLPSRECVPAEATAVINTHRELACDTILGAFSTMAAVQGPEAPEHLRLRRSLAGVTSNIPAHRVLLQGQPAGVHRWSSPGRTDRASRTIFCQEAELVPWLDF